MQRKKSVATLVAKPDIVEDRTKRSARVLGCDQNVAPVMKSNLPVDLTYQVPMELAPNVGYIGMRWILTAAKVRSGKSFPEKLAGELVDAANNTGSAIRRREETHKMAEANRAFSHYRL
jgi:small subunit ribosomal protein S7